jgi:UDP-N-acetylmuramoyl-tripeptide--D-alanyl-D-alanine ligase
MSYRVRAINMGAPLWSCRLRLLYVLAYVWRHLLFRTTFIAITGSVGKTTAKECMAAILSTQFSTASTLNNQNDRLGVPRTMLRVRPWHRFAVIEMGTDGPGLIRRSAQLVRPHVAVVLTVARSHTKVFSSLEEVAAEKSSLLDAVPPAGLAILNADDSRVWLMASGRRCQVKTFGLSAGQDLWADEVSSTWPETLTFRVHTRSEVEWVRTKLVGQHWTNSVLAGIAGALACGVSLKAAAAAVANVEPFPARMQPIKLPNGATMIRDELNGSYDTWQAAVKVLGDSQAARRVLVMSDVSDWHKKSMKARDRNKELGRIASRVAEVAIFVGEHAHHAVKAAVAAGMRPDSVHGFTDLLKAAEHLKSELRHGDLVLLRGRATDHLSRICFAQFGEIGCWKTHCGKTIVCDHCDMLHPGFDLQVIKKGAGSERISASVG